MKDIRQPRKAIVAAFAAILLLFSETAYGLSDSPATDNNNELKNTEQASPKLSDPALEPYSNEKREATGKRTMSENTNNKVPSTKEYIKAFPNDIVGGTERMFNRDNLPLVLIGSGLTIMALTIDGKAKRESLEDQPLGRFRNLGNTLGDGFVEVGAGGGMFLTGQLLESKKLTDAGIVTLEACLIDGVATEALKYAVGRRRPNGGGDKMSFPSGHTSVTATLAASVSEMYDWDLILAVPLYAMVALVGVSRMDSNMHYLSDVLAGATLGTLVGSSVAKYHKEKKASEKISFFPLYEKDYKGFVVSVKF